MEHRRLILDKGNMPIKDYLTRLFGNDARILFALNETMGYTVVDLDLPDEYLKIFYRYVAKGILLSEKYRYIKDILELGELNCTKAAFFAAILYFDIDSEIGEVHSIIRGDKEISFVGVGDFCMTRLKSGWQDILELVAVLMSDRYDEDDLNQMISFVMSTKTRRDKSLFLAEYPKLLVTNVTDGLIVETVNFFDSDDYNIIGMVIEECPSEFIVERDVLPKDLCRTLTRLTDVKIL